MQVAHVKDPLVVENRRRVGRWPPPGQNSKFPTIKSLSHLQDGETTLTPSSIPNVLTMSLLWSISRKSRSKGRGVALGQSTPSMSTAQAKLYHVYCFKDRLERRQRPYYYNDFAKKIFVYLS